MLPGGAAECAGEQAGTAQVAVGALDMAQRANRQWKQMLADYEPPPPLDPAADRELQAFVDDRKAAVPDAWY